MSVITKACPICKEYNLVFWVFENLLVCDECFRNGRYQGGFARESVSKIEKRIVFSPIQAEDGTWITSDRVEFKDLSQMIDRCIRLESAKPFLVNKISISKDAIFSLLDIAESLILDPLQEPQFRSLVIEIEQIKELIIRCNCRKEELEKDLLELGPGRKSSWEIERIEPNELYPPTERNCQKKERKIHNVEQRIKEGQNRSLQIQEEIEDMLEEHTSVFQNNVLRRLRNTLSDRCSYPPQLGNQSSKKQEVVTGEITGGLLDSKLNGSKHEPFQIGPEVPVKSVSWELLEPQHTQWEDLVRHYSKQKKTKDAEYDVERLKFVYQFNPNEIYVGKATFEGYAVFCFTAKGRVVLECPKSGNAIYLMKIGDWKNLSKLSKTELLIGYRHDVSRILHSDKWRYELELWIEHGGIPLLELFKLD